MIARWGDAAAQYTGLLRDHIAKENEVLFPMADEVLAPEEQEELATAFEGVEEELGQGVHERMHAVMERVCEALGIGGQV